MKRLIILLVVLSLAVVLAACSSSSSSEAQSATVDGWIITTSNFELVDNLASSISSQQYNGGSIEVEYKEKPAAGTLFALVKISAEKTADATANFSWDNAYIADKDGNKYYRHSNDTFLTNYNFKRIKSIDLALGTNEGYACYEVSTAAEKSQLFFVYEGADSTVEIPLN